MGWEGATGRPASIIFKKRKQRKRMKKGENREKRRNKNKKIKKITTNDHNAFYKWVKTEEFLRVTPLTPDFSEVRTFTDATIRMNAQACPSMKMP